MDLWACVKCEDLDEPQNLIILRVSDTDFKSYDCYPESAMQNL